jgi:hypothetical protein
MFCPDDTWFSGPSARQSMAGAIRPGTAKAGLEAEILSLLLIFTVITGPHSVLRNDFHCGAGPAPRRPPSIMPVMRPRTAAGAAMAPVPPPFGKTSAQAFRVEQKATYHGEVQVPSILFIGKAAAPTKQSLSRQKLAELSKYKLRPGALQELGVDEQDELRTSRAASPSSTTLASAKHVSIVDPSGSYNLQPYGGQREIASLRKQIVVRPRLPLPAALRSSISPQSRQALAGGLTPPRRRCRRRRTLPWRRGCRHRAR